MQRHIHYPYQQPQVLVHSFELDASFTTCSLPWICPRNQAHFPLPQSLDPNTSEFISLDDARNMLEQLNKILRETGFNPQPSNPLFFICILLSLILGWGPDISVLWRDSSETSGPEPVVAQGGEVGDRLGLVLLPWLTYIATFYFFKIQRERRLTAALHTFNRCKNGVILSLGGGGITSQGEMVGIQQGGTYENFYNATWDPRGLMFKGYLHVHVNVEKRQEWCRNNGVAFVSPVANSQLQGESFVGTILPPGFPLDPLEEEPPPAYSQAMEPPPEYKQVA